MGDERLVVAGREGGHANRLGVPLVLEEDGDVRFDDVTQDAAGFRQ